MDWELVDVGDRAWDCAGVMQHYWYKWISTTPQSLETWEDLQRVIEHFWAAYDPGPESQPLPTNPFFLKVIRLTGARLIQTSYEHFRRSRRWTPEVQRCAWLAQLLLTETKSALAGFELECGGG